jgi:hypothetical protein
MRELAEKLGGLGLFWAGKAHFARKNREKSTKIVKKRQGFWGRFIDGKRVKWRNAPSKCKNHSHSQFLLADLPSKGGSFPILESD